MHLATIEVDAVTTAAVVDEGGYRPLLDAEGSPAFGDIGELLASGDDWRTTALRASERSTALPAADVRIRRPILDPGAVVCVGVNYQTHVAEMGATLPEHPTLFTKLARSLSDPSTIALPDSAGQSVDYEGELALIVGRGGRDIAPTDAWDAIAGVTIANDVSMREFQLRTTQWFAGKAWESCTPVGPVMATLDELPPLGECELRTTVNGELRQAARLDDLIFDVPTLVAAVSEIIALHPGDLILTGTTGGVGHAMDPPRYLEDGDRVVISVDGVGELASTVRRTPR